MVLLRPVFITLTEYQGNAFHADFAGDNRVMNSGLSLTWLLLVAIP